MKLTPYQIAIIHEEAARIIKDHPEAAQAMRWMVERTTGKPLPSDA